MYISLRKKQRLFNLGLNLFPSFFSVSGVNQKHEEKYNRTSSYPMDLCVYVCMCINIFF